MQLGLQSGCLRHEGKKLKKLKIKNIIFFLKKEK
jgi:hypothetical protein